jgi:hypothetical protein
MNRADGTLDSHNRMKPNSAKRRANKWWLLSPESGFGGDGQQVRCWECGKMVTFHTLIQDRKRPGWLGGDYRRANLAPHCGACSQRQSQELKMLAVEIHQLERVNRRVSRGALLRSLSPKHVYIYAGR